MDTGRHRTSAFRTPADKQAKNSSHFKVGRPIAGRGNFNCDFDPLITRSFADLYTPVDARTRRPGSAVIVTGVLHIACNLYTRRAPVAGLHLVEPFVLYA